jgi:hypothetical protein
MKKQFYLLLLMIFLYGCATTAGNLNRLDLGMPKSAVIKIMGSPYETKARGNEEVLVYYSGYQEYWLVFEYGNLVQYGRAGDFETASPPTRRIEWKNVP